MQALRRDSLLLAPYSPAEGECGVEKELVRVVAMAACYCHHSHLLKTPVHQRCERLLFVLHRWRRHRGTAYRSSFVSVPATPGRVHWGFFRAGPIIHGPVRSVLFFFCIFKSARLHQGKNNLTKQWQQIMKFSPKRISIQEKKMDETARLWMKTKLWTCANVIFFIQ